MPYPWYVTGVLIKAVLKRTYQLVPLRPGSQNCGTKRQKLTKTVGRHNTETRETKSMVRKYQKFQNFSQR